MIERIKKNIEYYQRGKYLLCNPEELEYLEFGRFYKNDPCFLDVEQKTNLEHRKTPSRTDVINYLISMFSKENSHYLEIGVRNPEDNFSHIKSGKKHSVDPGVEFESNPVDFKLTSDDFFHGLRKGKYLDNKVRFDVVFIDGLHLAEQVDRDITNALEFLSEDGYIVLHDCNPPTEWHAREDFWCNLTPASLGWNGTVWKAICKWRMCSEVSVCCIDTDWGVGVISKKIDFGPILEKADPFFEYKWFDQNRKSILNLVSFDFFKELINLKS
jgi:hypothetical protein